MQQDARVAVQGALAERFDHGVHLGPAELFGVRGREGLDQRRGLLGQSGSHQEPERHHQVAFRGVGRRRGTRRLRLQRGSPGEVGGYRAGYFPPARGRAGQRQARPDHEVEQPGTPGDRLDHLRRQVGQVGQLNHGAAICAGQAAEEALDQAAHDSCGVTRRENPRGQAMAQA